jgi:hypothetical protein
MKNPFFGISKKGFFLKDFFKSRWNLKINIIFEKIE